MRESYKYKDGMFGLKSITYWPDVVKNIPFDLVLQHCLKHSPLALMLYLQTILIK